MVLVFHFFQGLFLLVSFSFDILSLVNEFFDVEIDLLFQAGHSVLNQNLIIFFVLFLFGDSILFILFLFGNFFLLSLIFFRMRFLEDLTVHFFSMVQCLVKVFIIGLFLYEVFLLCLILSHGVTKGIHEGFILRGDSRLTNVFG